ncbi:hypothetical protein PLICRDRAFT_173765 [Plicaturopsis crispa FD-325 SS-3]|nr:hypothetical protein PLICRDRAFT_173765 [Plicaturopsis crispa FD-325 SS-3]
MHSSSASIDDAIAKATRVVSPLPQQLNDMATLVSMVDSRVPDAKIPTLLAVFTSRLDTARIPRGQTTAESVLTSFIAAQALEGLGALVGLAWNRAVFAQGTDSMRRLWPSIWSWLEYIHSTCLTNTQRFDPAQRLNFLAVTVNVMDGFACDEGLRNLMCSTPGTVAMSASLWYQEATVPAFHTRSQNNPRHCPASKVLALLLSEIHPSPDKMVSWDEDILRHLGGTPEIIADTAFNCLQRDLSGTPNIEYAAQTIFLMQVLSKHTAIRDVLLLKHESIPLVTKFLANVSAMPLWTPSPVHVGSCINTCLCYILDNLEAREGRPFILQALNAQLLQALWRIDRWQPIRAPAGRNAFHNGKTPHVTILSTILTKYLINTTIVRVIGKILKKPRIVRNEETETGPFSEAWRTFKAIVERRSQLKSLTADKLHPASTTRQSYGCCENLECGKREEKGVAFLRCSGCHEARYCSKDCQKRAWKQGNHKQRCEYLQGLSHEGKVAASPHRDSQFAQEVVREELQIRREEIAEALKRENVTVLPVIHFDFTIAPFPSMEVGTTTSCRPIDYELEPNTRRQWDLTVAKAKSLDNAAIAFSYIPMGESATVVLNVIPRAHLTISFGHYLVPMKADYDRIYEKIRLEGTTPGDHDSLHGATVHVMNQLCNRDFHSLIYAGLDPACSESCCRDANLLAKRAIQGSSGDGVSSLADLD